MLTATKMRVSMTTVDQVTQRRRGVGLMACDPQRAGEGFTLIAPQTSGGQVHLIDMLGNVAHSWQLSCRAGRHAVILPNGNLGYNGYLASAPDLYPLWKLWHGGFFQEVTSDGVVVWTHQDPFHHHDGQWLPNGNILYGATEPIPPEFAKRIVGGASASQNDGIVYGDVIKEVNRKGDLVWVWRAWEHLDPVKFPIPDIFSKQHWPLVNGLNLTKSGLVLMSLRTTSGVIGVDRATGDVVFHIGADIVSHQHTPVELDNGNILIFDNGNRREGNSTNYSRVVEVDPLTNSIMWQYSDPVLPAFYSPYMGAAQRLPNGNTHITESSTGRLFDVTPDGDVVWEYVIPYFGEYSDADGRKVAPGMQNSVFRSYRYQPEQIPWL